MTVVAYTAMFSSALTNLTICLSTMSLCTSDISPHVGTPRVVHFCLHSEILPLLDFSSDFRWHSTIVMRHRVTLLHCKDGVSYVCDTFLFCKNGIQLFTAQQHLSCWEATVSFSSSEFLSWRTDSESAASMAAKIFSHKGKLAHGHATETVPCQQSCRSNRLSLQHYIWCTIQIKTCSDFHEIRLQTLSKVLYVQCLNGTSSSLSLYLVTSTQMWSNFSAWIAASIGRPAVPPGSPSSENLYPLLTMYAKQLWLAEGSEWVCMSSAACHGAKTRQRQCGKKNSNQINKHSLHQLQQSVSWLRSFSVTQ